jgi:hypothetical protein
LPLVDVIMPSYGTNWLWKAEAIASMKEEKKKLFIVDANDEKIIVVDDDFKRTEFLLEHQPPSYECLYDQINAGFRLGNSKYVLVFGSDDIMYPGMIQELVNVAEYNNSKIAYCDYEMMTENGSHLDYTRINPRYDFGLNCKTSHYPDVSLFRRDVIQKLGGWDVTKGRYAMWWLWLQIGRKYPNDIHHTPYFGFRYRQHEGGMHNRERRDDREAFVNSIREWLGHVPSVA